MRRLSTPAAATKVMLYHFFILPVLITLVQHINATPFTPVHQRDSVRTSSRCAANESFPLECLQLGQPIMSSSGRCQQTLMSHVFASSYGQPFIGDYTTAACDFNRVTINFTVTSAGRQFDRLALMYLGDIEVFRTSTAEPTKRGITWTYIKDLSPYISLFKSPQKIIFDLGNIVDDTYTGLWNTTLTATFFTGDDLEPADLIVPISTRRSTESEPSAFIVPGNQAINTFSVPRNAKKAVFSVSACGQAAEEFWWSNVLTSDATAFGNDTTLYGHSAFREVEVLIDGHVAGVAWPFPVIFTGGIVPGLWRPVVGIDAFDLRENEISITPFIPMLSDGREHSFEIRVMGIDDNENGEPLLSAAINGNWVVTGKLFLWLDEGTTVTTGTLPNLSAPQPLIKQQSARQQGINGTVNSLNYSIEVSRNLYVESTIVTSTGPETVYWKQDLTFSNTGILSNQGNDQIVGQTTKGRDEASSGYARTFRYPLQVSSSYNAPTGGNLTINATLDRAKTIQQFGDLAFPNEWKTFDYNRLPSAYHAGLAFVGSNMNNWQNGTASYLSVPAAKKVYSSGSTEQLFTLSGIGAAPMARVQGGTSASAPQSEELYQRRIKASNDSVVYDEEIFGGQTQAQSGLCATNKGRPEFPRKNVRAQLGRGPL